MLELNLPVAKPIASYNLWTANDVVHRDPVSWSLEQRLEDGAWETLDEQNAFPAPIERMTPYRLNGFNVVASRANLPGWRGPATMAALASLASHSPPPPTPVMQYITTSIISPPPPPFLTTPLPVEQHYASPQIDATPPWHAPDAYQAPTESGGASSAVFMLVLIFVILAVGNVAYHWRVAIARSARSVLGEDLYAELEYRLMALEPHVERARATVEQARAMAEPYVEQARVMAEQARPVAEQARAKLAETIDSLLGVRTSIAGALRRGDGAGGIHVAFSRVAREPTIPAAQADDCDDDIAADEEEGWHEVHARDSELDGGGLQVEEDHVANGGPGQDGQQL